MELIYLLTCFFQPILLPTPEAITISMGSMAFGSFNAFVMGFFGTMLGIATMYSISKRPFFIIAGITKMITIATYSYIVELAAILNINGIELIFVELVILIAIVSINGIVKYKKVSA